MARFIWVGRTDYRVGHDLQQRLLRARIADDIPDTVVFLEHEAVITVGRKRHSETNVLAAGDVPVIEVERGGDVTWHGPGQLVAYPIIQLEGARQDLHLHLRSLESAVIGVLDDLGVQGGRDPRNTGVWVADRKICSVGIACRKWVTWHGLAINVSVDLAEFERIRPCGFEPAIMTRLADHTDAPSVQQLAAALVPHLAQSLDLVIEGGLIERLPDAAW